MTHVTCRLTAKNRDQLRNPTLGNRVWATFTFSPVIKISLFLILLKKMKRYIGFFCIVGLAIFCVILHMQLKLYSRRFVPLLAPNYDDTTDCIMYMTPACLAINFLGNLSSILQETLKSHDSRSALSVFLLLNLTLGVIFVRFLSPPFPPFRPL